MQLHRLLYVTRNSRCLSSRPRVSRCMSNGSLLFGLPNRSQWQPYNMLIESICNLCGSQLLVSCRNAQRGGPFFAYYSGDLMLSHRPKVNELCCKCNCTHCTGCRLTLTLNKQKFTVHSPHRTLLSINKRTLLPRLLFLLTRATNRRGKIEDALGDQKIKKPL